MDILTDTNLLVGSIHREEDTNHESVRALRALQVRGDRICVVPQNLYELWAVATRPLANNGLGMTPVEAYRVIGQIENLYALLRDPPQLFDVWRQIVFSYGVSGKKAHDARLVAAMAVHGITQILTYNAGDFTRYAGINVIRPSSLGDQL